MKSRHRLNDNARDLRNNATDAERMLWRYLRNSQIEGIKFRRQQPLEEYIVDFVSFSPKLIVELDGGQHADNRRYDEQRDACLRRNGYDVLRFWNNEVFENIVGILEVIRQRCLEEASPTPQPPPAKGGGANKRNPML
jgi:very-short-patch-repair endonuclease